MLFRPKCPSPVALAEGVWGERACCAWADLRQICNCRWRENNCRCTASARGRAARGRNRRRRRRRHCAVSASARRQRRGGRGGIGARCGDCAGAVAAAAAAGRRAARTGAGAAAASAPGGARRNRRRCGDRSRPGGARPESVPVQHRCWHSSGAGRRGLSRQQRGCGDSAGRRAAGDLPDLSKDHLGGARDYRLPAGLRKPCCPSQSPKRSIQVSEGSP